MQISPYPSNFNPVWQAPRTPAQIAKEQLKRRMARKAKLKAKKHKKQAQQRKQR